MNIKQLSSDGKIAHLIKPILKVLQEAGGQSERSELKVRNADLDDRIAEFAESKRSPRKPETPIRNSTLSSILQLKIYSLLDYRHIRIPLRLR